MENLMNKLENYFDNFYLSNGIIYRALILIFICSMSIMLSCGKKTTEPNVVLAPTFSMQSGTYNTEISVTISCSTTGASIRYTTDGSDPSETSILYIEPISISTTTTIKAKAFKTGSTSSPTVTAVYSIVNTIATPTFNPSGGTYSSAIWVTISCATSGASIHYTTDYTDPTESSNLYTGEIMVSSTTTIKAKAYLAGYTSSQTAYAIYYIDLPDVATPVFSPLEDTYTTAQSVTISCATSGASIHYTTNGNDPTESSTLYSGAISVNSTTTIIARAFKSGYNPSEIELATYTINIQTVAIPSFYPTGGSYTSAQSVTISCSTSGASIRYTTNGNDPTESSSLYSGAISVNSTTTIKARAFKSGYTPSSIVSSTYNINAQTVATPSFYPTGGSYTSAQSVTISCATSGATIRYTTNGSTPTETSSQYSSPINIAASTTVIAKAFKTGLNPSSIASATYTINIQTVATPTFSPPGGTYYSSQTITISCTTYGATIRYTTNGSTPTETSSQYYSPINIAASTTVKAKAFYTGWNSSQVASASYTLHIPSIVGNYPIAYATSVIVSGNYAYVTSTGDGGLKIINISNPSNPTLVGNCSIINSFDVAISGNYAYVASAGYGLKIINISSPTNPFVVGTCNISGEHYGIAVSGNFAYIASAGSGLKIVNISNPSSPSLVGTCDTPGTARKVSVSGNYAYVADYSAELQVINVSNPASPYIVGSCTTLYATYGVKVSGNYAYAAGGYLYVVNISSPSNPTIVGSCNAGAQDIAISGNYAYVAGSGMHIINIASPSNPTVIGSCDTGGSPYAIAVSGNYVYIANNSSGLQIIALQ
jgi:hypothetical protein